MKKIFKRLAFSARGQSLVEMAVTAPILIFMLIGVFEVGWALRGYLVLVNVNREITRFAIRPGYMDFSTFADVEASFQRIREWIDTTNSAQLDLNFDPNDGNTSLIVSHIVVDTGFPCENITDTACNNCDAFEDPSYNPFPQDDLIIHPGLPNYGYQSQHFGPLTTTLGVKSSRIVYTDLVSDMVASNNEFNCRVLKKGGALSANNVIITEIFYEQPQLFGFPLISNPFTDPVPLYTHTTMRLISAARSGGMAEGNITAGIDTVGPVCMVYPMLVYDNGSLIANQEVNIIANGWLKWDHDSAFSNQDYLEFALSFPQMSLSDFDDAGGGDDFLHQGSQVDKVTGTFTALEPLVENLVGRKFIVPTTTGPGSDPVTINGFIWATIEEAGDIELGSGQIMAKIDPDTSLPDSCN